MIRTPLYKQVQQYILDFIQEKEWKADQKIPSENELAEKFSVSRITVKKALDSLVEEGQIYRIQGKGSFISSSTLGEPSIYEVTATAKKKPQFKLIACLVPVLNSELTTAIFARIQSLLSKAGYQMLLFQTDDSQENEQQIVKRAMEMGVDGIIIYPVEGETYNEEVLKLTLQDFPLVLIDRYFRGIEANSVCSDNFLGSYEAVQYLLKMGHSQIGLVSTHHLGTTSIEDRIQGYEKALTDAGISIDHKLQLLDLYRSEDSPEQREENKRKVQDFIEKNPEMSAIFSVSPRLEIIETASELGLRIPDDLSLILFDDYAQADLFATPPSCVQQQGHSIGEEAVKLLVSAIQNPAQKRKKVFISPKLIIRQSTAKAKETYSDSPHV